MRSAWNVRVAGWMRRGRRCGGIDVPDRFGLRRSGHLPHEFLVAAQAALFVLSATAARARIIATCLNRRAGIFELQQLHEPLYGRPRPQPRGEPLQVGPAVREEPFQAGAEIIESFFAFWSPEETILRTRTITHGEHVALATVTGQRVPLLLPEFTQWRAFQHLDQRSLADVADVVLPVDEMIAGEEVPIMFDDGKIAAGLPEDAERMLHPEEGSRGFIEQLDINPAEILSYPLAENRAQERAIGFGRNRLWTDSTAFSSLH